MKNTYDVDALCLEVFSKISATVTHEIKNTLSIINENAGLLNDLAMMAGEEGGIPSGQVDSATATITKQVARSNTIMLNLNRFSHSGNTPVSQANLQEILQLMVALTSRKAASKSVTVSILCPGDITITTCLLPFEALLFYVLDNLYDITSGGVTLCIEATVRENEVYINFTEKERSSVRFDNYILGEKEQLLAKVLGGTCKRSEDAVKISFSINKITN